LKFLSATALCIVVPLVLAGCGHCDGALRMMRSQLAELYTWPQKPDRRPAAEPVAIEVNDSFRIVADGPLSQSEELLASSGIDSSAWFLVDQSTGKRVAAEISADSGGHMCLNGVGFNLKPQEPLAPGSYLLVLLLDRVKWPLVEEAERRSYQGRPAMTRRYLVRRPVTAPGR